MVIIVSTTRFPVSKAKEVSERFIEVTKKFPPDRTLEKQILRMAARITGDEVESISITEVKEGKYEEVYKRSTKIQVMYTDIKGMKFKLQTFLSGTDALPMIGLEMPE
ncbi:MAG TPA: hypothetical protein VMV43_02875 [Candidatus Nanopelagicaceae bacterium]|nr:hypothetical protein [Candidatus Nanopelagicaceae bacterium]